MPEICVEFVFGEVDHLLNQELNDFWVRNSKSYKMQMQIFRGNLSPFPESLSLAGSPLSRHPAAIARDPYGEINGVVFVVLKELEASLGLGTHAYFQYMYVVPSSRNFRLSNSLFLKYLIGFEHSLGKRDHRAQYLIADNIHPGLRQASLRRYFSRRGFRMFGASSPRGEVWIKPLEVLFQF